MSARRREEGELESPAAWDLERAEKRPAVKSPRAVVSVALPRSDFELVSAAAERAGMRLSEFIRKAAMEKASEQARIVLLYWAGSTSGTYLVLDRFQPFTQASSRVSLESEEPVTSS